MHAMIGMVGLFLTVIVFPILLIILMIKSIKKTATKKDKSRTFILLGIGIALFAIGIALTPSGSEESESDNQVAETEEVESENNIEEIQEVEKQKSESIEEKEIVKRKEEASEENNKSFEYADMKVELVEYSIEENTVGEKCLVLYFDFTNNRDESQAFGYTFTVKTFQNGVELEPTYFHVNDETKNSTKEIKPGVTLRVAEQYGIEDVSGNIEVEIEPFNIWSDKVLLDYEFSLDE